MRAPADLGYDKRMVDLTPTAVHPTQRVPGRDGQGGALGGAVRGDRTVLSSKAGEPNGGRRSRVGLELLRIHFLQQWYALSDSGNVEEAGYESASMRRFVADLIWGANRRRTRRRCASFATCWKSMELAQRVVQGGEPSICTPRCVEALAGGTIVDATILGAPCPRRRIGTRRVIREMHSTKKGNQWHFGMKAHIGVDEATGTGPQRGDDGGDLAGFDVTQDGRSAAHA